MLKFALNSLSVILSDRQSLKLFQGETEELIRIFDEDNGYDVFESLLIPRVVGIEDSSRRWSVAMVLEHLCLTNTDMHKAIASLSAGIVPRGEIDVALYKPDPEIGIDVRERLLSINAEYSRLIQTLLESAGRLRRKPRYRHPSFGDLSAHQWHVLAALHQRIHRRQAQKIVAMLGVT